MDKVVSSTDATLKKKIESIFVHKQHNDVARQKIAKWMNIDDAEEIMVLDSRNTGLYLIGDSVNKKLEKHEEYKGMIVDLEKKQVIVPPCVEHVSVEMDELKIDQYGSLVLTIDQTEEDNVLITIPKDKFTINHNYEGVIVRIFKHEGTVYFSTVSKLNFNKSRWGNTKFFADMYMELGGPLSYELFSPDYKYSPVVHSFLVVHPELLNVCRGDIGAGFIVYLGYEEISKSNLPLPFPEDEIEPNIWRPEKTTSNMQEAINSRILYTPSSLTLEEANNHLKYGFHSPFHITHPCLSNGESVHVTSTMLERKIVFHVKSKAYLWRLSNRQEESNLWYQFVKNSNLDNLENNMKESTGTEGPTYYPVLPLSTIKELVDQKMTTLVPESIDPEKNPHRLYHYWMSFLMTVPLCKQVEVYGYLDRYDSEYETTVRWILSIEGKPEALTPDVPSRVGTIISLINRCAPTTGKEAALRMHLNREYGYSLHKIFKTAKYYIGDLTN